MIKLYNSLNRKKEDFIATEKDNVLVYQCGPTVYWTQHIGNMRAAVITDLLVRTLRYSGYKVKFARNYTDVGHLTSDRDEGEDKMQKTAEKEGKTPEEIAQKYIDIFERDTAELNILEPNFKPRATEFVPNMIEMVEILLEKGFAYKTPLAIYFDVSKAKDYTRLSGQILEDNLEEAGHGTTSDTNKKNHADFALWFFKAGVHKNAIQTWKNPFSEEEGFPGWHIECSAMIKKLLGDTIDIHLGGIEHIPVHHTNEIAQSESANERPFVKYWMHYEHLLANNRKMSKSEGTGFSLQEVKEKGFDALSLRYFFLTSHYRSRQNFTWEALQDAENSYFKLIKKISEILPDGYTADIDKTDDSYQNRFTEAVSSDLNMSEALAIVHEMIKNTNITPEIKINTIAKFDEILGLSLLKKADAEKKDGLNIPIEVISLSKEREVARFNKDWKMSDDIRKKILDLGYEINDTDTGSKIVPVK